MHATKRAGIMNIPILQIRKHRSSEIKDKVLFPIKNRTNA